MPKSNAQGGKKHKRYKKKKDNDQDVYKGKVNYATDGQIYALVKKRYGGRRIDVECSDGKNRSAIIPGKMWKKVWMNPDDVILCDLDATGDDSECYILQKYTPKEISILKSQNKISFEIESLHEDNYEFDDLDESVSKIKPQHNADRLDLDKINEESDDSINSIDITDL